MSTFVNSNQHKSSKPRSLEIILIMVNYFVSLWNCSKQTWKTSIEFNLTVLSLNSDYSFQFRIYFACSRIPRLIRLGWTKMKILFWPLSWWYYPKTVVIRILRFSELIEKNLEKRKSKGNRCSGALTKLWFFAEFWTCTWNVTFSWSNWNF